MNSFPYYFFATFVDLGVLVPPGVIGCDACAVRPASCIFKTPKWTLQ